MTNDINKFQEGGLPANPSELKARLQQARQQAPANTGVQYLKMNQFGVPLEGRITYGADGTEMEQDSEWVVNWRSLEHGFILRDGASVTSEAYNSVFDPLPKDLRDTKGNEQWRQSYKGELACVSGEDIGVVVEYAGDAGGVVKFFKMIMQAIESQLDTDPETLYPFVTMEVKSYYSNKQKKDIYEAVGKIVGWMDEAEMGEAAGKAAAAAEAEPAPEPEPDPEPPKPRRAARRGAPAPEKAEQPPRRAATRRRRTAE